MKRFLSFVVKEIRHILRDRRTMLILFGLPVVLMLLFGFAISTDVRDVRLVVVTSQQDRLTRQCVDALAASEYFMVVATVPTPSVAERCIRRQQADMAVVFGRDFGAYRSGIQFVVDAADPNMAQQWTAYAQAIVMQTVAASGRTLPQTNGANVLTKMLYNPQMHSSYNFVPGIMGMLLLLICAMMTSVSIVREKERGTMEVLLVSPVRPLMIILAKAVPYLMLALLILAVVLVLSVYVLGVPVAGGVTSVVLVSLLYIVLALSLGLLISNIAQTQLVALLMSAMLLLLPTVMLSGMLFPVESMPKVLQWLSMVVPPRYYIDAMRKLMVMGAGWAEVATDVAVMSAMTVLLIVAALKKFNNRLE